MTRLVPLLSCLVPVSCLGAATSQDTVREASSDVELARAIDSTASCRPLFDVRPGSDPIRERIERDLIAHLPGLLAAGREE